MLGLRWFGVLVSMKVQAGLAEGLTTKLAALSMWGAERCSAVVAKSTGGSTTRSAFLVMHTTHLDYAAKVLVHVAGSKAKRVCTSAPCSCRWFKPNSGCFPLPDGHCNLEYASPFVAVRVPRRSSRRAAAAQSVDCSRPNLTNAGLEICQRCPPIPGVGAVGYLELRGLPALAAVE